MTSKPSGLERLSTGSAAFDRILGGGLPVRSLTVVAGEPGAGKSIFALQVLFHLARQGRKCLYFTTLSEPSLKLIQYMQQFAFFECRASISRSEFSIEHEARLAPLRRNRCGCQGDLASARKPTCSLWVKTNPFASICWMASGQVAPQAIPL